jgi:hypothetical protein
MKQTTPDQNPLSEKTKPFRRLEKKPPPVVYVPASQINPLS